jgi:hypothetical protein
MDTIWYCYRKDNGQYAGSGTPHIDDTDHASTTIPCPDYDNVLPVFDGEAWVEGTAPDPMPEPLPPEPDPDGMFL